MSENKQKEPFQFSKAQGPKDIPFTDKWPNKKKKRSKSSHLRG